MNTPRPLIQSLATFASLLVLATIAQADPTHRPTGTPPAIVTQPLSQSVSSGTNVTLSVTASGAPSPSFQWYKHGHSIHGATAASYVIAGAKPTDADEYSVSASNTAGRVSSNVVTLSVANPGVVTAAPKNQTINTGSTLSLAVAATGTGIKYQWQFNGIAISGATSAIYSVSNVGPGAAGTYTIDVSTASGLVAADLATLSVATVARLTNLSVRGQIGTTNQSLTVGFVTDGKTNKQILLRAVGPTLATSFGVTGALSGPVLTLHGSRNKVIATNSGWGGSAALASVFAQVGAFALPAKSADAALLESLAPGGYSEQVTGLNNSSGIALAEIYDTDSGTPASTIVNISAQAYVASGGSVLTAGFVVAGTTSETVLIRGVGPTLKSSFGVGTAVSSTQVALYNSKGVQITANAGWGDNPLISNTSAQVGAFPLAPHSQDSALLVTIAPGAYTVQVSGTSGATGTGLVEIYAVQ